jgi:hypothetical protein
MVRRLLMSVALAIGLLAIAVSGLIVFRTMLAEAVLSSQLASLGIPAARLTVASLDLHRMVVTGIALGDGGEVRVDAATFAYSPGTLLEGRLEEAAIEGLRLRLDLSGAGPPLGSLQPLLQGGQGGGGAALLPAVVSLSRGEVVAVAPTGDMAAVVSGRWRPTAGTAMLTLSDLALPHVALETSRLDIEATPDRIVATARAHGNQDSLDLDLRATVDSWRSDPRLALALEGSLVPAAWNIPPLPAVGEGTMALSLQIEGRLQPIQRVPLDATALNWLLGANLRGQLQASLRDIAYRNRAQGISGTLDLAVTVVDGDLGIEIADEGRIRIARVDPALLDALGVPAVTTGLRDARVTVTLPLSDAPLRLRLRPTAAGADLTVSGAAGLAMAQTALEVRADGALALDKGFALRRVSFPRADLRLRHLTVGEYRLEKLHFTGAIDGSPGDLEGTGDLTADLGTTRIETLAVGATGIALTADFHWIDRRLDIRQRGDGTASVASLGLGKVARVARPFALRLADGALTLDMMPGGLALSHAITIRPEPVTVDLPRPDATALAIRAEAGTILLEGGSRPGESYRGKLTLARGRLAIPDPGLTAEAISASLVFPATVGERLAQFTIGQLLHTASPAYFAPLRIDGEIGRRKDALLLKATGSGAGGGLRLSLDGRHRIADGRGELQVGIPETIFRKGALQPADLFPLLRDVRDATGRAGGTAKFAWGPDGLKSEGRLDMAGVSFLTGTATVEGLDSRISLDGLLPPSTVPGQEISVRRIDPGLPLDDVEAHFQLEPAAPVRLRLEDARARFAGGRLSVDEAVLDPSRPRQEFGVGVDGVDLGLLLTLLKVEGLSATGRITGTIPIVVIDRAVTIRNGQLAAEGPGVLSVQSKAAAAALGGAGEQVALVLSALEDFRYDALSATLDMGIDGDAATMVRMQGHNPAVLEGYPFAFNIGLSGNLPKLFVALRQGAGLSTDLVRPELR